MTTTNNQTDGSTTAVLVTTHDRLAVFSFLWGCQALVHQEFYAGWLRNNAAGWIVTVAALAVLARPRSVGVLCTLLATSIAYNFGRWPYVVNHIMVESIISATMIAAFAWTFWTAQKRGVPQPSRDPEMRELAFRRFAPVVAAMVLIMYGWAFVAKLNTDFFDLAVSCVNDLFPDLQRRLPFLPTSDATLFASLWGTILIEGSIPVLLLFRRTRPVGIAVGLLFHFMLGIIGHRTFSAMVFALYFLFASERFTDAINSIERQVATRFGVERRARTIRSAHQAGWITLASVIALNLAGMWHAGPGPFEVLHLPWLVWIVWSAIMISIYAYAFWRARPARWSWPSTIPLGHAAPRLLWLIVPFVMLNGATQYIGLKTETSFTMYSNVRTEGERWNHYLIPSWTKFMSIQDDLVEIIDTDDPEIEELTSEGELLAWFELRRLVNDIDSDGFVRYRRADSEQLVTVRDGEVDDPELSNPSWIARKLLYFRPVDAGERQLCRH